MKFVPLLSSPLLSSLLFSSFNGACFNLITSHQALLSSHVAASIHFLLRSPSPSPSGNLLSSRPARLSAWHYLMQAPPQSLPYLYPTPLTIHLNVRATKTVLHFY